MPLAVQLYPAIDLRDGRCVRLHQGDYAQEAVYGDDPVAQAQTFAAEGARWIHVVDLDAARTGEPRNRETIAAIVAAVSRGRSPVDVAVRAAGGAGGAGREAAMRAAGEVRDDVAAVRAGGTAGEAAVRAAGDPAGGARDDVAAVGPSGSAGEAAVRADSGVREVAVQVGGGVRDDASADALLDAGVHRLVVGTAAIEAPDWVRRLAGRYPGQVAVGLDARGRDVAVRGWVQGSGRDLVDVARGFDDAGVAALIVTEIGRDGTLAGPALDQLTAVLAATELDVIASGGVGSLADLRSLVALEIDGRRLAGAIVGRALYEGAFRLPDAIAVVSEVPEQEERSGA